MALKSQYEFLFIGRDEGSFVENYAYDLGDSNDGSGGSTGGRIFINLEVQNNPADSEAIGETIFDVMRKSFFADVDRDPYVRFEEAVKVVNKSLADMKAEKSTKFIGNFNALITAVVDNNLYLTQCGEAEAYLIRRRLCTNVSDGLGDENSNDVFTNIASGSLEPGDLVLLNSTRLLRYITKTDLAKICSGRNLVAILGELKEFLSGEVLGKIGIIGIGFMAGAQAFSPEEKGQISAHLDREVDREEAAPNERKKGSSQVAKNSVKALKGMVATLSRTVTDLRGKLSKNSQGGRSSRTDRTDAVIRETDDGRGFLAGGNWSRNKVVASLVIIVLILGSGVWWLRSKALEQQQVEKLATVLTEVQDEVASATTTGQYNKDQAGQMLDDAEKKAVDVLNSGYYRSKANELLQTIQDSRSKLDGVFHPTAKVLVDLSSKRQNVSALGLISLKNTLYAYEYNALYPIIADQLQSPLTIDENETVIAASAYDDQGSLLFFTKSGKLIEYKDNRMSNVVTSDPSFHKGVAIQGYSNKLYILDPEQNQIWKYIRRRDKFDIASAYSIDGALKNAVSFAIDGNVYVLNKDGSMSKLFGGNKVDFPIKKQPVKALTNPTKIFTQLDMSQVYILEPSEKRVMVYYKDDKTGGLTYNNQYVFDDIPDLRDVFVDKDTNRMYLLDSSKVYTVNL